MVLRFGRDSFHSFNIKAENLRTQTGGLIAESEGKFANDSNWR